MSTGRVNAGSRLIRTRWVMSGLMEANKKSFWMPLTSNSKDSIVYQVNALSSRESGNTVVFDHTGVLNSAPIPDRQTAFGQGSTIPKFNSSLTAKRFRLVVDHGDEYDAATIGDLNMATHTKARSALSELFIKTREQGLYDTAQGLLGQAPTHEYDLGTDPLTWNVLVDLENAVRTSTGFGSAIDRSPMRPYMLNNGEPCWLLVLDPASEAQLRKDNTFQNILKDASASGTDNVLIKNQIGKIGSFLIVVAPQAFVTTNASSGSFSLHDTGVYMSGLRRRDANNVWSGMKGYVSTGLQHSRCLILGSGALQSAYAKEPTYHYQDDDFELQSQSALEYWWDTKKLVLTADNEDYDGAAEANIDHGVESVIIRTQPA